VTSRLQHPSPQHSQLQHDIAEALRDFLADRRTQLTDISQELAPGADELAEFVLQGGKRIRPTFAYWGFRGAGGPSEHHRAAVAAVASLELIQACALIHDDVMDSSDTRRGRPAVHRRFAVAHAANSWRGSAESHGEAVAILLGDFALIWADQMLRHSGFGAGRLAAAWPVFETMRTELVAGQYLDLVTQAYGDHDVARSRRVAVYKAAKYTIEHPLLLGNALALGGAATAAAYTAFGIPLGEAFQLRDDVLGVFGDPAATGKPAGDDLREGKRTVLIALAMQRANPAQAEKLRRGVGNVELDDAGVAELREILTETKALAALETMIADLTDEARHALADATEQGHIEPEAGKVLADLASLVTDRVA
jgi:geranylgeranyl diphosphate synthase type I